MTDVSKVFGIEEHDRAPGAWEIYAAKHGLGTGEEFYRAMTKGLPEGTLLDLWFGAGGELNLIRYLYNDIKGYFCFSRKIAGGEAGHINASVSSELRGHGIATTVNRNLFRLYQKTNVTQLKLSAVDIGIYTWARCGFVPDMIGWDNIRRHVGARLDFLERIPPTEGALPKKYIEALRESLKSDDPKTYWFIVDQQYKCYGTSLGKMLTLHAEFLPENIPWSKARKRLAFSRAKYKGLEDIRASATWSGEADLTDPDVRHRMKAYLFPQAKAQPSPRRKIKASLPA